MPASQPRAEGPAAEDFQARGGEDIAEGDIGAPLDVRGQELRGHLPGAGVQAADGVLAVRKGTAARMKLKKMVATYIATQLSEAEIETMRDLFQSIDDDQDGYITVD